MKRLAESDDDKKEVLTVICSYWSDHSQYIELLMDKLVNYKIFTPLDILRFSLDILKVAPELPWIWPVLLATFHKMVLKYAEQGHAVMALFIEEGYLDTDKVGPHYDQEAILEWLFHTLLITHPEAIQITGFDLLAQSNTIAALILNQIKSIAA